MHGNGRVNEVNMGHLQRGWFHTPMIFSNRWTIHMTYRFIHKHLSLNIPRIWYTLNVSKISVAFAPKRSFIIKYIRYICVLAICGDWLPKIDDSFQNYGESWCVWHHMVRWVNKNCFSSGLWGVHMGRWPYRLVRKYLFAYITYFLFVSAGGIISIRTVNTFKDKPMA